MENIRNAENKLVCRIDRQTRTVEIVQKKCITKIRFLDNGQVNVINANKVA